MPVALLAPGVVALAAWRLLAYFWAVRSSPATRTASAAVGVLVMLCSWVLGGMASAIDGAVTFTASTVAMLLTAGLAMAYESSGSRGLRAGKGAQVHPSMGGSGPPGAGDDS